MDKVTHTYTIMDEVTWTHTQYWIRLFTYTKMDKIPCTPKGDSVFYLTQEKKFFFNLIGCQFC